MKRSLNKFKIAMLLTGFTCAISAHVPHDIIYSLDLSPDYADTGMVLSSSTQFGECHLVSHNFGETYSESIAGMDRSLVTGHTFSPNYRNDGIIYMVTKQGYYKSSDRAKNWKLQKPFSNEEVLNVVMAPDYATSKDLYILTAKGVHKVNDDGKSTELLLPKDKVTFGKLLIKNGELYAHCVYYDKQKMIQGMEHIDYLSGTVDVLDLESEEWSVLGARFKNAIISDLDISGNKLLVALKDGSVHLKQGVKWNEVFHRDGDYVAKLKFSPDYGNDGTIVLGTAKGFVFMTEDRGQSWEMRSNGLSRWVHHFDILINRIAFSPNYKNDKTIFLGKTTGIYKTTDNGSYWRHINIWNTKWGYYVLPAPGTNHLFTATYNSGISRSLDNGDSWESANIGITAAFANGMVLSPNYEYDKSIFVVDIATGLYRSTDSGESWERIPELDSKKIYDKPSLFRELGVSHRFKDDGVMLIFLVPRHVLGTHDRKMVFKFNDITKEVKQVYVEKGDPYVNSFAFSPATSSQDLMYCASSSGVSMSVDKGDTWKNIFNKIGIQQIFISPNVDEDGTIYLMDRDGKIHLSTNNGASFDLADMNLEGQYVNNLTFSPDYANDNAIYVTTFGEGVLKSTNGGKSWKPFGLRGKFLYTGLSFSSNYQTDKTIFAPAVDGIYRSLDNGRSWSNVMAQTQLLAKDVFFSIRSPEGKDIPLMVQAVPSMKKYDMFDEEAFESIYKVERGIYEKVSDPRAYLRTYYKLKAGSGYAFEFDFYGNSIVHECVTGPDMGIADIFLDGEKVGSFDFYSPEIEFLVTSFSNENLPMGYHKLRIEMTGDKNRKSTGTAITHNAATIKN